MGTVSVRPRSDRVEVRLTPALVVLVVALGVLAGLRPAVASPVVTAVLWVGLVTIVVVGVLWPLLDRRHRRPVVTRCATDAVEGVACALTLSIDRGGFPLEVRLDESLGSFGSVADPDAGPSPPVMVDDTVDTEVVIVCRGVYERLALRVTYTGPFGLLRVTRSVSPALAALLYVGPRAVPSGALDGPSGTGEEPPQLAALVNTGDTVRSVRPYVAGDPAHLVHWPTSAHAGELMVFELEPPAQRLLVVVVDLRGAGPPGSEPVERAVRTAAGAVQQGFDSSMRVVLCTAQRDGPLTSEVTSPTQMRRRLAAAVAGEPGPVPTGATPLVFTPATVGAQRGGATERQATPTASPSPGTSTETGGHR